MSTLARRTALLALSPIAALALLAGGCQSHGQRYAADPNPSPESIKGKYIAVLCDADMPATAFADGLLGARNPGSADALTVVSLPIAMPTGEEDKWQTTVAQVPVSNSVMGPPASIAVTADGKTAYIVESRGPASPSASKVDDLPVGRTLTAVCMEDPAKPHTLASMDVGAEPRGVDVSPDGRWVAVVLNTPGSQLLIVPTSAEKALGEPLSFPLPGLDSAARPSSVAWHNDGRHLAVTLPDTGQVAFFEFNPDIGGGTPGIAPWGAAVSAGKYPFMGKFSPCGRFFIVSDVKWGADVPGFLAAPAPGQVFAIRLSEKPSSVTDAGTLDLEGTAHQIASAVEVGISPESLAISPDGKFVVTANLKGSFLNIGDDRFTPGGSLSLLGLNADTGLTLFGEFPINAMPEGLAFDATGRHLIVSQFRSFEPGAVDGELAFFRILEENPPRIDQILFWVGVGTGPHGVLIVR
jgi:DNA-binding beta-propeller fold protein YncE